MMRRFLFLGGALLPALLLSFACGSDEKAGGAGGPNAANNANADANAVPPGAQPWGDPPASVSLATCDNDAGTPADESSGYLLITKARLAKLQQEVTSKSPRYTKLKANVDRFLPAFDGDKSSMRNAALMYLLTKEQKYADGAYAWTNRPGARSIRDDSYLYLGDHVSDAALVLNWAKDGLSAEQQKDLADFIHNSLDELWFHTQGSAWGVADSFGVSGNNYRMAFIEGTTFGGYALRQLGDARGQKWVDLANQKLTQKNGVFDYAKQRQLGGYWLEGSNYGERSKGRLSRALAVIASLDGKNFFNQEAFFSNSVQFAIHEAQPGAKVLYPGGDLTRTDAMEVNAFDHEYMSIITYWLCDGPARRLGQYYVTKIADTYEDNKRSFDYTQALYLDLLYTLDIAADTPQDKLPTSYLSDKSYWVNARSGWDDHAVSYSLSASPFIEQSHQHFDTGSFFIYKDGWLMVNPENYGGIGGGMEITDPGARQGLQVTGFMPREGDPSVPGFLKHVDHQAAVYTQIDNSQLYRYRRSGGPDAPKFFLNEHTRELVYLRPGTVFVYDRVDAKDKDEQGQPLEGKDYHLNFHFGKQPQQSGNVFTAAHASAGIALAKLLPAAPGVTITSDGNNGGSYRIEEAQEGLKTTYLNVIEVAAGAAPALNPTLVTSDKVAGALWNNTVVVFSKSPKGAPAALPFSYTVANAGSAQHFIVNLAPNTNVTVTKSGDTFTVAAGGTLKSDAAGTVYAQP